MQGELAGGAVRIGLVGTYPPTRCGIATFTRSLATAMRTVRPDCEVGVVAAVDGAAPAA